MANMKKLKTTYKNKVKNYVELVEKPGLPILNRMKLIALITIEEHNREIIDKLIAQKVSSVNDFLWQSQLRFAKTEDEEQTKIEIYQTNCKFDYGYEYQGNNGRLVVTPLTDRAYMTLTNALNMQRGGALSRARWNWKDRNCQGSRKEPSLLRGNPELL